MLRPHCPPSHEQTILAGSNHSDVVPLEAVAAERIDDLDIVVSDLQARVQPESPRVEQRDHRQDDEQCREPERAVSVDHVRENRDRHTRGKSERRYQHKCHGPGAPDAPGLVTHRSSFYRHEFAPPSLRSVIAYVLR